MSTKLTDDQLALLNRRLSELGRRVNLQAEYRGDPEKLARHLQYAIGGNFPDERKWYEEGGVIHFSVTTGDSTGLNILERLMKKGIRVSPSLRERLTADGFYPTQKAISYLEVFKGEYFDHDKCTLDSVRIEAGWRDLHSVSLEVACAVREKFTDKELDDMGICNLLFVGGLITDMAGENVPSAIIIDVRELKSLGVMDFKSNNHPIGRNGTAFVFLGAERRYNPPGQRRE